MLLQTIEAVKLGSSLLQKNQNTSLTGDTFAKLFISLDALF